MTAGVIFTCRTKPFERGLRDDAVCRLLRDIGRDSHLNHRPGTEPPSLVPEVFPPSRHRVFFEERVSVAEGSASSFPPTTVFVTTGFWGWTDKLVGHERAFFEPFVRLVRKHDRYASVGVGHLLLVGSTRPGPLDYQRVSDIEAVLSFDIQDNQIVEAGPPARLSDDSSGNGRSK